jgi:dCTP diphosphatase
VATHDNRSPDAVIADLAAQLKAFAVERDWEQFHSPKNLAMALAGECGEVLEHFQWLSETDSASLDAETTDAVALELADVFIYTVRLADQLGVDLMQAAQRKVAINAIRYPADRVRGDARRAAQYEQPEPKHSHPQDEQS